MEADKNKKQEKLLNTLKLDPRIKLKSLGFISNQEVLNYIKSSDIYITKSGGAAPAEGFAIQKPMVVLDVLKGHEHEHALFFKKNGLALINADLSQIGKDLNQLFNDEQLVSAMLEKQREFRNAINIGAISDYVLAAQPKSRDLFASLGVENGVEIQGGHEALDALNRASPADVEILLSYPMSKSSNDIKGYGEGNPFGHIDVKIGDRVFTVNHLAKDRAKDPLLSEVSLRDYLYGTRGVCENADLCANFGLSYGREVDSIRLRNIPKESIQGMLKEVGQINIDWKTGAAEWDVKKNNCADFVRRILTAGGYSVPRESIASTPLDVFESYMKKFAGEKDVDLDFIRYAKILESENPYLFSRFPLSLKVAKLAQNLKNLGFLKIGRDLASPFDQLVTKRITSYPNSPTVYFEQVRSSDCVNEIRRILSELR